MNFATVARNFVKSGHTANDLHLIDWAIDDPDFDVLAVARQQGVLGRDALAEELKDGEIVWVLVPQSGVLKLKKTSFTWGRPVWPDWAILSNKFAYKISPKRLVTFGLFWKD